MTQQDFSRRSTATELMDTDPVSFKEFDDYLRDLERINVLTLAYRPTLLWLKRALADFPAERPISVLDVGSGGGGMLRQLRKWARGKNLKLDLTGVDINPWSTRFTTLCQRRSIPSPTARLGHDARQCGPPHREPQRR